METQPELQPGTVLYLVENEILNRITITQRSALSDHVGKLIYFGYDRNRELKDWDVSTLHPTRAQAWEAYLEELQALLEQATGDLLTLRSAIARAKRRVAEELEEEKNGSAVGDSAAAGDGAVRDTLPGASYPEVSGERPGG